MRLNGYLHTHGGNGISKVKPVVITGLGFNAIMGKNNFYLLCHLLCGLQHVCSGLRKVLIVKAQEPNAFSYY
jgi:hypothetical protein